MTTRSNAPSGLPADLVVRVVEVLAEVAVTAVRAPGTPVRDDEPAGLLAAANGDVLLMQVIEVFPQPKPAVAGTAQHVGVWLQQTGVLGGTPCYLQFTVAAGEPLRYRAGETCLLTLTPKA